VEQCQAERFARGIRFFSSRMQEGTALRVVEIFPVALPVKHGRLLRAM
jgi:hypothetical protein